MIVRLFLFTFLITSHIFACDIISYSQIIKINNVIDDQIIKSTNCSENITTAFINLIQNSNGIIPGSRLKSLISTQEEINLSPNNIHIYTLAEEISNKLNNEYIIKDLKSLYGYSSLNTDQNAELQVECSQCKKLGIQNIKLIVHNKTYWLSAKIGKQVNVYRAVRQINTHEQLLMPKDFKKEQIITFKPSQYFLNIDDIKYFRLNRHLEQGDPLKVFHLNSKNLIQYGQKVHVNILNKSIQLQTTGISKKAGKLGDFINIENPSSKKKYLGKVIDYNKVEVKL